MGSRRRLAQTLLLFLFAIEETGSKLCAAPFHQRMGAVFSNVDGCCCDEAPGPEAAPAEPPPRKPQPVIKKQPAPQPPAKVTSLDPEPKPELLVLPERTAEPDVVPNELMD